MDQKEFIQLLLKSSNINKKHSSAFHNLDTARSKPGSKDLINSIFQGQDQNKEIIDSLLKNLENKSNPFYDIAELLAKKIEIKGSELEKFFKQVNVLNIDPGRDAYVSSYYPKQNFGMSDALFTGKYRKEDDIYRTYLHFDTSAIPTNTDVTNAIIKLNIYRTAFGGDNTLAIYKVLQDWREDNICWQNQPQANREPFASMAISPNLSESAEINITDICKEWILDSSKNYGILLRGEEKVHALLAFKSKQFPNSEMHPRLEIEYNSSLV